MTQTSSSLLAAAAAIVLTLVSFHQALAVPVGGAPAAATLVLA